MAVNEFPRALLRTIVYEGGKVDNPRDPGGRTAYGVTQSTFNSFLRNKGSPSRDVFTITTPERDLIYRTLYWNRIDGDALPMGVGFCVFDAAVNSGVGQSVKWLQSALGRVYTGEMDGQMGSKTLQAVDDHGDPTTLIEDYCSRRLGTLKRLKTWGIFGKGWAARVANVQKIANSWADAPSEMPIIEPIDVMAAGGHAKATVNDNISQPPFSQITTHITTAAGAAGVVASQAAEGITPVADSFAWLKYVLGGFTLLAVIAGILVKIISDSNTAAAAGVATAVVDPDADANFEAVKVTDLDQAPAQPEPILPETSVEKAV